VSDLEHKAVFITGCDTGFGRESALKLARQGCPIFAGCLTQEGLKSIENEARGLKGRLVGVPLDITSDESVKKAVEFVSNNLPSQTSNKSTSYLFLFFRALGPTE
jgi:NAD(P)-dependent dehydrogenase (short-subunit alcohol dehydrogenase family)